MAAKLKACQEILPPSRPLTEAEYHAHQRRIQMITSKSPSLQQSPSAAAAMGTYPLNVSRLNGSFNSTINSTINNTINSTINSTINNLSTTVTPIKSTNSHESLPTTLV